MGLARGSNRRACNLLKTEKICSYADKEGVYSYDFDAFLDAQKNMSAIQFHDVLSGTCIIEVKTLIYKDGQLTEHNSMLYL
jgi:hypothetical protein